MYFRNKCFLRLTGNLLLSKGKQGHLEQGFHLLWVVRLLKRLHQNLFCSCHSVFWTCLRSVLLGCLLAKVGVGMRDSDPAIPISHLMSFAHFLVSFGCRPSPVSSLCNWLRKWHQCQDGLQSYLYKRSLMKLKTDSVRVLQPAEPVVS